MEHGKLSLLIVEDDPGLQSQMRWALADQHDVHVAADREEALALANRERPSVVVLDLGLPPDPDGATEGLAVLQAILEALPRTKVIIASGNDDRENAVRAIGLGAYDFCSKPVDVEMLSLIIDRAWHVFKLEAENQQLLLSGRTTPFGNIITENEDLHRVCRTIEKVAATDVTVLVTGESGTGKELVARALHDVSPRAGNSFVAINCAAIPETLLESELFGFEKGAFTGAAKQTIGKIEMADQGTLFLDEIGDLPSSLQAKLLRFLQDRVVERLGGRRQIPVDLRIVCATNQNLEEMIAAGTFREDLFYRLNEIGVYIPPLRERQGDAVLLARYFLDRFNKQYGKSVRGFSDSALVALGNHRWPGNVRQLENLIKKAVIMAEGKIIKPDDLDMSEAADSGNMLTIKEVRERAERRHIREVLAVTDGNISKTARLLGVSRPTLYDLLRNLDISLEE